MKRTALLLTMIMVLAMIFTLSGCSFSLDATLTQGTFVEGTFVEDLLIKSYNINFVINGETTTVTCKQGLVPTAPAVEDYETDSKSYTFIGWDKEIVAATEDATYTAVFSATTKLFDVTFAYGAGKSDTVKLHWGAEPAAPTSGLNYKTADKIYTFIGWDKEIVPVNGEVVYTAQYEETVRTYNVYFVYGTGYVTVETAYGALPVAPTEGDFDFMTESTVYTFKGWEEVVEVTGEAEYYAIYEQAPREYTITFIYDGKTETATFKYGETVVLPTPAGYSDATGSYSFKAWDKEAAAVTGEATYTAEYVATSKVLYSQDFNSQPDFDIFSADATVTQVLDPTWTLSLSKGGSYAKTEIDANDPNNKYVVAGLLATNNAGTAQFNPKGKGLASMGDFTKLSISVDLAAKDGVKVTKSYIRTRSSTNKYYKFLETFNGGTIKFNGVDIEGVTINTTMQTFTFEFDFVAGTATLLVNGEVKYTGAIASSPADLGTTTYAEYIAKCTGYMFNWAIDKTEGETAIIIDNLALVAHN